MGLRVCSGDEVGCSGEEERPVDHVGLRKIGCVIPAWTPWRALFRLEPPYFSLADRRYVDAL
jgi:hypothetical protein